MSFNLSAHDLSSQTIPLKLLAAIGRSRFPPERISFEITETALEADFSQAKAMLGELKKLGCCLSLDDFGTGYSNLSRLHTLPLSTIKIDRSLVAGIQQGQGNHEIVDSLMALFQRKELRCITEGVETQSELNTLREMGVRYVQGYYFSPPVNSEKVSETVAEIEKRRFAS